MEHSILISLIMDGCKLAKDLESNLGNLANQPDLLSKCCDDIIKIFAAAKERLSINVHQSHRHGSLVADLHNPLQFQQLHQQASSSSSDPNLQELLKYGVISKAVDMIQQQVTGGKSSDFEINELSGNKNLLDSSSAFERFKNTIGEIQQMDVSDSGRASSSSSSQRPRRRKDDEEKCRMTVPAPQMGNTDLPPEDNYTWRKYGQKEILGSRYPRAYYRCTHQKMYNCPAKKQVQRLDNDYNTFEVTYIGQHTCHMSSTAPSIAPPPPAAATGSLEFVTQHDQMMMMMSQAMVTQPAHTASSSVPLGRWLSMEFSLGSTSGSGSRSVSHGSGNAGGTATTANRYGRDVNVDYPAVADMADVMFNTGSSSSNSMDFIFPSMEDKWDHAGDKKN